MLMINLHQNSDILKTIQHLSISVINRIDFNYLNIFSILLFDKLAFVAITPS